MNLLHRYLKDEHSVFEESRNVLEGRLNQKALLSLSFSQSESSVSNYIPKVSHLLLRERWPADKLIWLTDRSREA